MMGCYTVVSLALIGIPPASGFVSKWYLASGALSSGLAGWSVAGPAVLLVSALLTAGYLLPLTINGFFPAVEPAAEARRESVEGEPYTETAMGAEPSRLMLVPMLALTAGALLFGCFPGPLLSALESIAAEVL